jgi:aspartyl/asparaginyl beta-hydroxylase (cupin superfamily)
METTEPEIKMYGANTLRYKLWADVNTAMIWVTEKFIWLFTPNNVIFPNKDFAWIEEIEKSYPEMLEEFNRFCRETNQIPDLGKISDEESRLVKPNQWKFIPLYMYGNKVDFICDKLPRTTAVVQGIPDLTTAFFSILTPHAKITEHRGAYKGYLRYHLGIRVPEPYTSCGLQIKDQVFHWQNGKSVVFDDTFRHSAWNNTDQVRVVLWVDFIRPMPFPLKAISVFITKSVSRSPYIQNIMARLTNYKFDAEMNMAFD